MEKVLLQQILSIVAVKFHGVNITGTMLTSINKRQIMEFTLLVLC